MKEFVSPPTLARPSGFSHIVRATGKTTIYISGQVSYDKAGAVVGANDIAAQTKQVFLNLQAALGAGGATMQDVVKTVFFVRDLDADKIRAIREVRTEFFDQTDPPASTMIGVAALARPELLLEVEAIAVTD